MVVSGRALADVPWPAVAGSCARTILAVPLGSTEQHGHHLPNGTDTVVADALAAGLARRRPDVAVAPPLPYGASGEHAGFPGTLSVGTAATAAVLVELVRSADAFRGVVLVNGHGGNADAVAAACERCRAEGRQVLAWSPAAAVTAAAAGAGRQPDAHAGWVETSMMLAIAPSLVRTADAVAGATAPLRDLLPELRSRGVSGVSASGVLGDPAGATADAGRALVDACVDDLAAAVRARFGTPDAVRATWERGATRG